MALTLRTNGSSGVNLVSAQWWNDYYNLLTGVMTDQTVTLKTDLVLQSILSGTIAAPTLALATGTNLGIGLYNYYASFVDAHGGETTTSQSAGNSITTTTGNQAVNLTAIATGPTGTVARNIYRTLVGGSIYYRVAQLADNTTTTYSDTVTDASLNGNPLAFPHPTFGGWLDIKNGAGQSKAGIYSDGAFAFDSGNIWSDGLGTLNANAMVAGYNSPTNTTVLLARATNGAGTGVAGIQNSATSGQNSDLLALIRITNQPQTFTLGIDSSAQLYLYDGNSSQFVFQGLKAGQNVMTNRNGTLTAVAIFTGTGTPSNPPTGAIWVQA